MILHKTLPYDPFTPKPLPGISPLAPELWIAQDECADAQVALRRRLMDQHGEDVVQMAPEALVAAQELLLTICAQVYPGCEEDVQAPDGRRVKIDFDNPMQTIGKIVQQDFCILQKPSGSSEHVLTAAVLCFPASWRLADKFMRPLTHIHIPVPEYDTQIAKRVQRLFDGVKAERGLWRFNALWYDRADLYHPDRAPVDPGLDRAQAGNFLRSEMQNIVRLPKSDAVVFSIHTHVLTRADALAQFAPEFSLES